MLVCGQYFSIETIDRIQESVSLVPGLSRTALSRLVCEWLNWRNPKGDLKEMSCRKALLKLHRKGVLCLPESTFPVEFTKKNQESISIAVPPSLECRISELEEVELVLITKGQRELSRIWNGLMDKYHYLGSGPLCGAQLRYLLKSSRYGWLGGLSFSAGAWRLEARDRFIGWSDEARRIHLSKVVNNSRFLILPHLQVPNLASFALSLGTRRLSVDWVNRYGYSPVLLETFVEQGRFAGTCYRAANWLQVGSTKGRGRQDRENKSEVAVKSIFLYPLVKDWAERLQKDVPANPSLLEKPKEVFFSDWAEEEFGGADLGDKRLTRRLQTLARDFYERPQANIPQACGSRAKTKAAYRFFESQETTMDRLFKPHYEATTRRIHKYSVVLVAQDTTSLNYTSHHAMKDIGPIASRRKGSVGLLVHDTLALNVDGTPLGLLDVQCWKRNPDDIGKKSQRRKLPIEQRESSKWLKSFSAVAEIQKKCPNTMLVSVGDREADIFELFDLALRDASGPKLLVRAEHNRLLAEGHSKLWEKVMEKQVSGIQELRVPRQGKRPAREARMAVRFAKVELKPNSPKLKPAKIWAVLCKEENVSAGVVPLEWMLLTTVEVNSIEDAVERLRWYALRWGIEVYHRTLKSGCRIENRQLGSGEGIKSCLVVDMVVAWRIFHLTKLGREIPNAPCSFFFEEEEWKALSFYVNEDTVFPAIPPTLREAIHMVAGLGGFLGRKGDGEPGTQTIWRGLQRLDDITAMWIKMKKHVPQWCTVPVSRKTDYG